MNSKLKDFKLEDDTSYIKYLKRHPSVYAESHGIQLYWFQKVLLFVFKNVTNRINKYIKR